MFSVIIPLYNKENFIERTLLSVFSQNYKNFEIIVINDGSTDSSLEVVEKLEFENLKIFTQKNAGVSAARNFGAQMAQFPYLVFLDGDDTWEINFLQSLHKLILEFPNCGIYGTNNYFLYPSGKSLTEDYRPYLKGKQTGIIEDYFGLFAKIHKSPFSNSNICIPKNIYNELGGYKVGVKLTEDSDLWCRIALKYPIAFNNTPLATYFLGVDGSTHSILEENEFQVETTLRQALESGQVPIKLRKSVQKLISFQKLALVKRALLVGNKKIARKKIFDYNILRNYPIDFIKCIVSLALPNSLFYKLKNMFN